MDRNKILKKLEDKLKIFGPFSIYLLSGIVLGIFSLVIFVLISRELIFSQLNYFDNIITEIIRYTATDRITLFMKILSNMGSLPFLIIFSLVVITILYKKKKHFWDTLHVPVVVLGSVLLNLIIKGMFHRPRPNIEHFVYASGLSFPSGHSMVNFSFYGLLIYLTCVNIENKALRYGLSVLFGIIILLIGISRIYLGVHYPSDVLAGFAAGSFWLVASIYGFKYVRYYKSN